MRRYNLIIIVICFFIVIPQCSKSDQQDKPGKILQTGSGSNKPTPRQKIESYHSKRIRVDGIYVHGEIPAMKLLNMATAHRKGIVHLIIPEEIKNEKFGRDKIWNGDHIMVIGIARTQGVITPEIIVQKIEEINN